MLQRKELALQDEFGNAATLRAAPNYWLKLVGYRDVSSEFEFQDLVDEFARGNLS